MGSIRFLWIISAFVLLIFSCKKKISSAGSSNLSSEEYLNGFTVDTFDLLTYTVEEDSIITDNAANVVLGYYNDPEFGHFESSFYTQVLLGGAEPNFGDANAIILDSFVLSLEYDGYYGDVSPQTFEVYEVDESLSLDSTYYTFSTLSIDSCCNKDQIEKCSESTGINLVLFLINFFSIRFHAQIIDSLFAIAITFVCLIIFNVGSKPLIPTMELME